MARFIQVRNTSGEEYMVNLDHIYYIKAERDNVNLERIIHKVVLPDEVIWVTKPMFDKIKLEIQEY